MVIKRILYLGIMVLHLAMGLPSYAQKLSKDSTSVQELAPLDIAQNRGIIIATPDREMQMRIVGSVRMLVVMDQLEIQNKNALDTYDIPTGEFNQSFPNYFNGLDQTRLGFEVTRKTPTGTVFAQLETDFAGPNGFRIRHAYGKYRTLLVGQTWSLFSQINALPATVDFTGPIGSVVSRNPQLRYTHPKPMAGMNLAVGLEYILPDLVIPDSLAVKIFQYIPDITFRLDKTFSKVYWQLSGMIPILSARTDQNDLILKPGWGLATSALISPWQKGKWYLHGVAGKAIARMITDLSGHGLDILIDSNQNGVTPLSFGGYAGYEHNWSQKLTSNFIYSLVKTEKLAFTEESNFKTGYTLRTNTFWNAVEGAKLGTEIIWGNRTDKNEVKGSALRLNFLFYYDF